MRLCIIHKNWKPINNLIFEKFKSKHGMILQYLRFSELLQRVGMVEVELKEHLRNEKYENKL